MNSTAAPWIQTFIEAITLIQPSPSRHDYSIPYVALDVLTRLLTDFPTLLQNYLSQLLPPIWSIFTTALPLYESEVVRGEVTTTGGSNDIGDDVKKLENLATAVIEFIRALAEKKSIRKMMEPHLDKVAYLAISCIQFFTISHNGTLIIRRHAIDKGAI